ncbi:MAG: YdaU family protein [Sutterella sp.]|nr:YdaU family protein [Sutterella sp.]
MNFVQWHIGDWLASTSLMSPLEKGIYMDLLMRYYREERGITCDECTRIARAYAENEVHALNYILETHFVFENGMYIHARCEQEILNSRGVSERKRQAAKARWSKHSSEKEEKLQSCTSNARAYANAHAHGSAHADANAMQGGCICNALTNNQYIYKEKEKEIYKEKAKESFDDSLVLTSEPMPAETAPKVIPEGDVVVTSTETKGNDDGRKDNSLSYVTVSKERRRIPFKKIMTTFNEVIQGTRLDQAMSLEDSRKRTIAARIRELVKVKPIDNDDDLLRELRSIFQKVVKDPWYLGNNQYGYVITFTDIFSPKNFTRFLERSENYQPREQSRPQRPERRSNGIQPLPNPADFSLEDA